MYPFKELGFPPYRNNAITSILCDFGMQRKISKAECCLSWDKVFIFERLSWLYWDLTLNKPDPTWPGRDEKCPGFT